MQRAGDIADGLSGPLHEGTYLTEVIDAFLLSRRVANCTRKTLEMYEANLPRFVRFFTEQTILLICVEPEYVDKYFDNLRRVGSTKRLRDGEIIFTGPPKKSPLRFRMKPPRTLPRTPDDERQGRTRDRRRSGRGFFVLTESEHGRMNCKRP
ncbi:MAG TPA: hypothetical protein VKZ50_11090 [bacterium]|nr:hypothetical protein [bacterium]